MRSQPKSNNCVINMYVFFLMSGVSDSPAQNDQFVSIHQAYLKLIISYIRLSYLVPIGILDICRPIFGIRVCVVSKHKTQL